MIFCLVVELYFVKGCFVVGECYFEGVVVVCYDVVVEDVVLFVEEENVV